MRHDGIDQSYKNPPLDKTLMKKDVSWIGPKLCNDPPSVIEVKAESLQIFSTGIIFIQM